MFDNNKPMLSALIISVMGGETMESIFARQLADENGWHFVGSENDYFKFHDFALNKEVSMSADEVMFQTLKK